MRKNVLLCNVKMLLSSYKNIHRIGVVDIGAMKYEVVCNTEIIERRDAGTQCFYGLEGNSEIARQVQRELDNMLANLQK